MARHHQRDLQASISWLAALADAWMVALRNEDSIDRLEKSRGAREPGDGSAPPPLNPTRPVVALARSLSLSLSE
jgi:hypothetical protein